MTNQTTEALAERITAYLSEGGLFNPELAEHAAVRDLLIDCRAALSSQPPAPSPTEYRVFQDGNAWCAVGPGFVNIQESPCAFSETAAQALFLYIEDECKRRATEIRNGTLTATAGSTP